MTPQTDPFLSQDVGELTRQCAALKPDFRIAAVTGSDDQIAPPKDMEHYKRYVRPGHATIEVVQDAGHTFKSGFEVEMLAKAIADCLEEARKRYEAKHGRAKL